MAPHSPHPLKHHSQQHYDQLAAVETPYLFPNTQLRHLITSSIMLPQLRNQVDPRDPLFVGCSVFPIYCRNSSLLSLNLSSLLTYRDLLKAVLRKCSCITLNTRCRVALSNENIYSKALAGWPLLLLKLSLANTVGWFGGGMLRQEPPLSNSYSPKISHSTNPQCNVIQSASANHSTIKQNNASGPVARSNVAQHPARQGNSESSPRTEHGPNWVGLVRSPETQTQPVKNKISGWGNRTSLQGL
ncbi:hypothetical protein CMV_014574 [Castanea mollissima]|uniref:Uncharacterized protein n=1 Tax=Castanea mollissima TaxID=60419 RepID=A0A8J4RBF2_9ROSI|nr:hypothetical protein CMV_014574 [Castanea mollissima]